MFDLEKRDLRRLNKQYKRLPNQFQRAAAGHLNVQAFGTRKAALEVINRRMRVRNPRFVKGSVRVVMARGSQPIPNQKAQTGSIERQRFSGWVEQELNKPTRRTRVPDLFSRGGQLGRQVRPSLRMKSANQFLSPDDYPGNTAAHRTVVMLKILERQRHRKPFIIKGHRKFKRGLYQFKGRRLHRVQSFEPANPQPRRIRWLTGGRRRFFQSADMRAIWTRQLNRVLKRGKTL